MMAIATLSSCSQSKNLPVNQSKNETGTPLRGIYWRLTAVMGQSLTSGATTAKEAFIKFNVDGKSVGGNGGCNTFGGSYEMIDSSHISFGPIMSTKMYCEDAKYEMLFLDLLERVDNFYINNDTLFLRNKGMDSTARFVANYFKKADNTEADSTNHK